MTKKLQIIIIGIFLCFIKPIGATESQTEELCMAQAIYHEAGNESSLGQYAVGEVIMNRIHAGLAKTVCGVVNQHVGTHWQFGFNKNGQVIIPRKRRPYFYGISQDVLSFNTKTFLPPDVLYFNNHPFDKNKFIIYTKIGHQYFFIKRASKNTRKN